MYRLIILSLLGYLSTYMLQAQNPQPASETPEDKRLLIVSGGGATGAWGGGLTEALFKDKGFKYDAVIGSSTGSLIAPFVLTQSFDTLRKGYTNITDRDIFSVRPFKTKGPKAGKLRTINAIWRIITQRKTLGESKKLLKKTLPRFFSEEDFYKLRANTDCDFLVTLVNVLDDKVEYRSIHDPRLDVTSGLKADSTQAYKTFLEWMWASANFPVFMSLYEEKDDQDNKSFYFDGGIKESIPLEKGLEIARKKGYKNIDVIIHSTRNPLPVDSARIKPALNLLGKTIDLFRSEVRENDVKLSQAIGRLENSFTKTNPINITIYYMTPEDYASIPNQLVFDQEKMKELWEKGTNIFRSGVLQNQVITFSIDDDEILREVLFGSPRPIELSRDTNQD